MNLTTLTTEKKEGILFVTINRPDKLNALNKTVFAELDQVMDSVYQEEDVHGVIITGAGTKAFVAGADISEFENLSADDARELSANGQRVFFKIEDSPKPVIAAVNGFALGGGCELAMACHIRIAAAGARFGQPEVNLGLIPGYGGTQRLGMLVGKGKAMELILTGNMVGAEEARELGLVNQVTSAEDLLQVASDMMRLILSKSPVAVSKAIAAINSFDHSREGFDREVDLFKGSFDSADREEGTRAFLEKRKPVFRK